MVRFHIVNQTFIDKGPEYLSTLMAGANSRTEYGLGVFYSQLNHTLYTIEQTGDYIHIYDLRNMTYETLQQPIPSSVGKRACLASSNPSSPTLYVTGGYANGNAMENLQIWEVNVWRDGPDMTFSRRSHGCIVVNDWLWVMGSETEIEAIDTTNIDDSSWDSKGELDRNIASFGIVAVNDLIYVIGGCTDCDNSDVDTMYIIDTINGNVTTISMGFLVQAMPVVAVDGIIYGFGGYLISEEQAVGQETDKWALYDLLSDK